VQATPIVTSTGQGIAAPAAVASPSGTITAP
jgi:hypothetical protein